jgi:EAL domain-containing protein (putative c-di-GMP-specific phosphodiesterase class I)
LLDILQCGWRSDAQAKDLHWQQKSHEVITPSVAPVASTPAPVAILKTPTPPRKPIEPARVAPTPLPAVMRSLLVEATDAAAASFGTIALPEHSFAFNHRRSADESDLNVSTVADEARVQMFKWMTTHDEPVIINEHDASQTRFPQYKLLAYPIRVNAGPLLALMVLFRGRQEPLFTSDDLTLLAEVTAQIPAAVIAELQRIHTRRTLALQFPAQVKGQSKPQAKAKAEIRAEDVPAINVAAPIAPATIITPSQQADAIALLLPEYPDEDLQDAETAAADEDVLPPPVVRTPLPTITERVRIALSHDAFELHAQRITPLHDYSRPERFEVLLRMPDKYGLQTPATFMAAAQAGELMPALDLWVIRHTLSMLRLNNRLGRNSCELSVNLSAASLADATFIEQALGEIRSSNIKPGQLGFEIAEQVALPHQQAFRQLTEQLHAVGCRVTLDNCRSGVGIFELLPPASINCIKIDGSIVREAGVSPATQSLLEALVQLAAARGIESVAEHVESQLICSTIISSGFDYAQGFHLEVPAPLAKLFY